MKASGAKNAALPIMAASILCEGEVILHDVPRVADVASLGELLTKLGVDVERQPDGTDRFGGLAWQVPDIDAIRSRLLADRFDVSEIRDGNKAGTRVCTVREPVHDVPTLLIEPVS